MFWVQYSTADGTITGSNSQQVNDDDLAALGRAQVAYDGVIDGMMVDITQNPPVVIPAS